MEPVSWQFDLLCADNAEALALSYHSGLSLSMNGVLGMICLG